VVQNKIDIVSKEQALNSYKQIKDFLEGTIAESAPIIPVSAHHDVNLDVLIQAIEQFIPTPERDPKASGLMHIARSFDINRPGARPNDLKGGVLGGSIVDGTFSVGDRIVVAPGRKVTQGNKVFWEPLVTTISSMKGGGQDLDTMHAGGLCGIATPLDPSLTKADELTGQVASREGELPPIWNSIELDLTLLKEMVTGGGGSADKVRPLQPNEMLMVNSATATSVGVVSKVKGRDATLTLRLPICAPEGGRITLSRRVGARWRLIGYATIK